MRLDSRYTRALSFQNSLQRNFNHIAFREVKESVAGGRTQTGKTAFKVALAILGRHMGVAVVCVCVCVCVCVYAYIHAYIHTWRKFSLSDCTSCQ